MPFDQLLSLILLVLVFLLAISKKLNIGILALAATLPLAVIAGVDAKQVFEFFDGKLVVLIAGVSLLFAHMKESGALTWLIVKIFDVVGDRVYVLPWAVFILGAALSTAGAIGADGGLCVVANAPHVLHQRTCCDYRGEYGWPVAVEPRRRSD